MSRSKTDKESTAVNPNNLFPSVIKTDVNLSRLPLFALTRRGLKTESEREWVFAERRENEHVELVWRILASQRYGYPSPFAKKVHRAVEYLLTQNGFPVPKHLEFSLYQIANILDLGVSGRSFERIRDALKAIATTTIESQGTYCYLEDGEKRFINKLFGLYDSVVLMGETLPNGTTADRNYIDFNEWYLKSLNSFYIKPLDFPYWKSFQSDIARRLYEYLSLVSYATKCKPFSIEYQRLAELLPVTPQRYLSLAKHCMKKAHQELIKTKFLRKVVWRESKTEEKRWVIIYYFGTKAKSELQRGFRDDTYRPAILAVETAEMSEIEAIEPEEENAPEVKPKGRKQSGLQSNPPSEGAPKEETFSPIAQELINRGITESVAVDFAENLPEEYLAEKIEMHDVEKAIGELTQNAAGWLREAITRDFKLSEEEKKKQERLVKVKAEQEVRTKIEEQAREIQEQRLREALATFPSEEEWIKARVSEHIKVREEFRKFDPTTPSFTEEEIEQYWHQYRMKFPKTDDERRSWLTSSDDRYNLQKIISEFSELEAAKEEKEARATEATYPLNSIE